MTPTAMPRTRRHASARAQHQSAAAFQPRSLHVSILLAGAALSAGFAGETSAFTPNAAFTPVKVTQFSGTEGTTPGALPFAPPVYVSENRRLYGITQRGGYSYTDRYGEATFGGAVLYSVNPASPDDSYQSHRAQTELGRFQSMLPFWDETTKTLYSASTYVTDPDNITASYDGIVYGLKAGATGSEAPQAVILAQPDTESLLPAASHKPTGQLTVASDGYAYYSPTNLSGYCYQAGVTGKTWNDALEHHPTNHERMFMTYRIKLGEANAQPEAFANWCDFASAYVYLQEAASVARQPVKREYHPYGSQPTHMLTGDNGKYLYAISQFNSASTLYLGAHNLPTIKTGETIPDNYPEAPDYGIPASDNKGIPVAGLIRIDLEALNGAALTLEHADKIEVLHWFAETRDGGQIERFVTHGSGLNLTGSYANGIIEIGDWIYGTNQTVWRVYKGSDASVTERFQIVHDFGTTVADDGSAPGGPLVLAADGNIYGTTYSDQRKAAEHDQTATGTLFRLVVDQTNPNGLPTYEPLQYLDFNTVGAQPTGLSAGDYTGTHQRLYGATQSSVNVADATTPLQQGAIFRIDVPLPTVFTQQLTASATQIGVGGSVTLNWKAENVTSCAATGDNGNLWQGDKPADGSSGASVTLTQAGTFTFGLDCVRSHGGPVATSDTVTVTVTEEAVNPDNGNSDSDSGGGGGGAFGGLALMALGMLGLRRGRRQD